MFTLSYKPYIYALTFLDVLVRFDPTFYTTTETRGNVTVWIHVEERVTEPFTVALIPGEGNVMCNYILKILLFYMQGLRSLLITIK